MNPNEKNIYNISGLPKEQQLAILNLIATGTKFLIAYDMVVYGAK